MTLGGLGSVWFSSECIFSPRPESLPWLLAFRELCVGLNEALESSRAETNRTRGAEDKGVFNDVHTVMAHADTYPATAVSQWRTLHFPDLSKSLPLCGPRSPASAYHNRTLFSQKHAGKLSSLSGHLSPGPISLPWHCQLGQAASWSCLLSKSGSVRP